MRYSVILSLILTVAVCLLSACTTTEELRQAALQCDSENKTPVVKQDGDKASEIGKCQSEWDKYEQAEERLYKREQRDKWSNQCGRFGDYVLVCNNGTLKECYAALDREGPSFCECGCMQREDVFKQLDRLGGFGGGFSGTITQPQG